jgi:hypothetical protein
VGLALEIGKGVLRGIVVLGIPTVAIGLAAGFAGIGEPTGDGVEARGSIPARLSAASACALVIFPGNCCAGLVFFAAAKLAFAFASPGYKAGPGVPSAPIEAWVRSYSALSSLLVIAFLESARFARFPAGLELAFTAGLKLGLTPCGSDG